MPWQVAAAAVGTLAAAVGWIGKRAWALVEAHVERRTKAVESIAPAIDRFEQKVIASFAEHARRQEQQLAAVEHRVVDAIEKARDATIGAIALEDRIEGLANGHETRHSRPEGETTLRGIPALTSHEAERVVSTRRGSQSRRGER